MANHSNAVIVASENVVDSSLVEEMALMRTRAQIIEEVDRRSIRSMIHLTSVSSAKGILKAGRVLSRKRIDTRPDLRSFLDSRFRDVTKYKKRGRSFYPDYVCLSVQIYNQELLKRIRDKEIRDSLAALIFAPEVMGHEDVLFSTTANHRKGCNTNPGLSGFSAMFASEVVRRHELKKYGKGRKVRPVTVKRSEERADAYPTCDEASVLYPGELSCDYLSYIVVAEERAYKELQEFSADLNLDIRILHRPQLGLPPNSK